MAWQDRAIFCVGISHKTASLSLREQFHLTDAEIATIVGGVSASFALSELVILSTCNRCELYGVVAGECDYPALFAAVHSQLALPREAWKENLYVLTQQRAVEHMLSVAAGIDSSIIGETQITGQFKRAFALAREAQTCGVVMTQILQTALTTAKKIRTHTEIGNRSVSISYVAILLAKKIFTDVAAANVLIVGAGEMASIAARNAVKQGVRSLAVINRTLAHAEALCHQLHGNAVAVNLTELPARLAWAEVVITATTGREYVILPAQIEQAQRQRRGKAMALIDISLPRNIDPRCQQIEDVYLFDLDDLRQITDQNLNARQQAVAQAAVYIAQGVDALNKNFVEREIGMTVAGFKSFLLDVVRAQTDQTLAKSLYGTLSVQQRDGINQLADIIVNKIVGQVSMRLKDAARHEEHVLATFRHLYQHPSGN